MVRALPWLQFQLPTCIHNLRHLFKMFKGRFPRVSFRAEIPFIFGLTCVFGMWTKMHHGLMLARKSVFLVFIVVLSRYTYLPLTLL